LQACKAERVRARVRKGGHDVPEADIRRRYKHSRLNLIELLPKLTALRMYDNSAQADPAAGQTPNPRLVLYLDHRKIVGPNELSRTPDWAKPIVAAALKLA
jgi:predicted ABC-type ATPase